ncbi:hypothetical protein [Novosphingobium terrae]|uniref:hypothetical protein n=1 Tax=Novosphingobium terrae TaxID=2726189 RepID=UPI001981CE0C|nr:hypothetical protein [Novosphingobium terrae]
MKKPTVCIVESLGFLEEQSHREGEIISRTMNLSGKPSAYVCIRTLNELKAIAQEFGNSKHRYFHLSCHGVRDDDGQNVGVALTTRYVSNEELADILAPHMDGRRLFLSSCLAGRGDFPRLLLERSKCHSVLAPMNEIGFDDAAVFWTSFYHLMFKADKTRMVNSVLEETVKKCALLVNERFRFYTRVGKAGEVKFSTLGPLKIPKRATSGSAE